MAVLEITGIRMMHVSTSEKRAITRQVATPRFVVWFWRVEGGERQNAYRSIVMTTEPPTPRPGDHGPFHGRIDQRLNLGT